MPIVLQHFLRQYIRKIVIDIVQKLRYTDGGTGNGSGVTLWAIGDSLPPGSFFYAQRLCFGIVGIQYIHGGNFIAELIHHRPDNIKLSVASLSRTDQDVALICVWVLCGHLIDPDGVFQNAPCHHCHRRIHVKPSVQAVLQACCSENHIRVDILNMNTDAAILGVEPSDLGGVLLCLIDHVRPIAGNVPGKPRHRHVRLAHQAVIGVRPCAACIPVGMQAPRQFFRQISVDILCPLCYAFRKDIAPSVRQGFLPHWLRFRQPIGAGSVFFYAYDVIQIFFPIGSIANDQFRTVYIGSHDISLVIQYRKPKAGVVSVHTVLGILALRMPRLFPPAVCGNLDHLT